MLLLQHIQQHGGGGGRLANPASGIGEETTNVHTIWDSSLDFWSNPKILSSFPDLLASFLGIPIMNETNGRPHGPGETVG